MPTILDSVAQALCWVFFVYKWIIIIAILLTWVNADPYNPLVQWINRITQPLWYQCRIWLSKILPQRMHAGILTFDAYVALLLIIFIQALLPATIRSIDLWSQNLITTTTLSIQVAGHSLQGIGIVFQSLCTFLMIVLAIWFFLTLVSPSVNNPIVRILYMIVDPLISPLQRYLPRSSIDFSPVVALGILFAINYFLLSPLLLYSLGLSFPIRVCVF